MNGEQHRAQRVGEGHRARDAQRQALGGHHGRLARDERDDVARARAQRAPYRDLMPALGYGIRQHPVEADGGQQEGESGEDARAGPR